MDGGLLSQDSFSYYRSFGRNNETWEIELFDMPSHIPFYTNVNGPKFVFLRRTPTNGLN